MVQIHSPDQQRAIMSPDRLDRLPFEARCPRCYAEHGQAKNGRQRSGSIKVKCNQCNRCYTLQPKHRGYPRFVVYAALSFYKSRGNYREVARICGVHHQTVINWVKEYRYGIGLSTEEAWLLRLDENLGQFFSAPTDFRYYHFPSLRK